MWGNDIHSPAHPQRFPGIKTLLLASKKPDGRKGFLE
jgi:hypothetical protein